MKRFVRGVINALDRIRDWASEEVEEVRESIYGAESAAAVKRQLLSLWDYLKFRENTQAFHLNGVIGFEEWVEMEEIRRRVKELYGVGYKNGRSLYPYIKTLTDSGLFETTNVGGRMRWRKRDLIVEIKEEEKEPTPQGALTKEATERRKEKPKGVA